MIRAAKARGLHGFVLTDHNTCDAYHYLVDQGLARLDGVPVNGFLVVPGVEVSTAEGHLLCVGACLADLKGRPALEVCHQIRAAGGLAIPPHAYDVFRAGIREPVLDTLPMDAIEIFNSASSFKKHNQRALAYASRKGIPMTAGSDAHHHEAIGTAYTSFETQDFSVNGVIAALTGAATSRHEQYLTLSDKVRKTWNNWFRLRRKRTYVQRPPQAVSRAA
jgi:predicted metal-dependent phosphoesterase TrpH